MTGPFHNAIKGTTASAPGTGAFTPNAASAGYLAWSTIGAAWWGLVRFEEAATWETIYSYWNGTTLSRSATQRVDGSSGSLLTLTAAATATLVEDGAAISPHLGTGLVRGYIGIPAAATAPTPLGLAAVTVTGTAGTATIATTNFLTEQARSTTASLTTANAQAGYSSGIVAVNNTAAGRGGWDMTFRFGASTTLPTGPRLFAGMTGTTFVAQTIEPSAFTAHYAAFAKDSTDTNIQLLTNSNVGTGTKITTGIPLVLNSWYHAQIWMPPGGATVYALLVRLDTGAIFYTFTTTDIPGTATMRMNVIGGLSATIGTAFTLDMGAMIARAGAF